MACLYILWKLIFVFTLLTPIFLILWVFKKFSAVFDLSKHTTWNLVSIPLYLTYLTAFFLTIWTISLIIWSFYEFILTITSYFSYIFVWIAWSLWDYDFFRNVVITFYIWLWATLSAFIIYRAFNKFGKVN